MKFYDLVIYFFFRRRWERWKICFSFYVGGFLFLSIVTLVLWWFCWRFCCLFWLVGVDWFVYKVGVKEIVNIRVMNWFLGYWGRGFLCGFFFFGDVGVDYYVMIRRNRNSFFIYLILMIGRFLDIIIWWLKYINNF